MWWGGLAVALLFWGGVMLLTDGNPNDTEDLRAYESAILGVANTESIDLGVKLGLATEEITQEVLDFLLNRSGGADPQSGTRRSAGVSDVVVTRQMKRWHALHALEVVYRDAFNNQLNDRYKAKFFEYKKLAGLARMQTLQYGVGLVTRPVPVAELPSFSFDSGTIEARTYFARVAWVSATGQEGLASPVTTYDAPAGSVPVVEGVNPPANATGFHVYLGLAPGALERQTDDPVAVGQAFMLPGSGLAAGVAPGDGQVPDVFVAATSTLRRG
jgi:hypothetical protein